jgi:ABC-2 type transport system ATP-binding protein
VLVEALGRLDAAGVEVLDVSLRRPTLDDVFLSLTGRPTEDPSATAGTGPAVTPRSTARSTR